MSISGENVPALSVSKNFVVIDYAKKCKIENTILHVFWSMTVRDVNFLHTIMCELNAINFFLQHLLCVHKNPQLAGFLLTRNRSIFLDVECSTAWIYDCPPFLSPLYKADCGFDRIPIHDRDTITYVNPITRQTYGYATPTPCDHSLRNIIELDLFSFFFMTMTSTTFARRFLLLKWKLQ